jgi:tRNA pseudouridine38-40 synthase
MRNIVLILSYLGTSFVGWQKSRFGNSIEEELEKALHRILRETPKLQAASRTDAGVHAQGQVVNFTTQNPIDLPLLKRALNGTLPKGISVLSLCQAEEDFHPTLDSIKKEYRYILCNSPIQLPFHRHTSWHVPSPLDLEAMRSSASSLLGSHDFSAFCNERSEWDRNPICHLESISFTPLADIPQPCGRLWYSRLLISVVGDHFLYKMARNIVGTLVYVGQGKLRQEDLPQILQSKQRALAGITAPALGLSLYRVYYKKDAYDRA